MDWDGGGSDWIFKRNKIQIQPIPYPVLLFSTYIFFRLLRFLYVTFSGLLRLMFGSKWKFNSQVECVFRLFKDNLIKRMNHVWSRHLGFSKQFRYRLTQLFFLFFFLRSNTLGQTIIFKSSSKKKITFIFQKKNY
jgi:hypothetical protein